VPLEIFTPPAAGALAVVLGVGIEPLEDLPELPHPAAVSAIAGTMRSTVNLLTETSFG
jgi:hypothetical protein